MSLVTMNGEAVISAELTFPRVGAWLGQIVVQSSAGVALGAGTMKIGSSSISACVYSRGFYQGRAVALIVGGKSGKLGTTVTPYAFRPSPVRTLLEHALTELGEALSPSSDVATVGAFLPRWTRPARSGGAELAALAELSGSSWRFLDDGSVWFGPDTFPAFTLPDRIVQGDDPARRRMILSGSLVHTLRPGVTFEGRRIGTVALRVAPGAIRAEVSYAIDP